MTTRSLINVYLVERDNFDGHYRRRYTFDRPDGNADIISPEHDGLAVAQDLDGGLAATISLPGGSRIVEGQSGEKGVLLPGCSAPLTASELYAECGRQPRSHFDVRTYRHRVEMLAAN